MTPSQPEFESSLPHLAGLLGTKLQELSTGPVELSRTRPFPEELQPINAGISVICQPGLAAMRRQWGLQAWALGMGMNGLPGGPALSHSSSFLLVNLGLRGRALQIKGPGSASQGVSHHARVLRGLPTPYSFLVFVPILGQGGTIRRATAPSAGFDGQVPTAPR